MQVAPNYLGCVLLGSVYIILSKISHLRFFSSCDEGKQRMPLYPKELFREVWSDPSRGLVILRVRGSQALAQASRDGKLDSLIRALSNCYRSVYGDIPWEEYLLCSACGSTLGKGYVYGGDREYIEDINGAEKEHQFNPASVACTQCGAPMTFYYELGAFIETLRQWFQRDAIGLIFLNSLKGSVIRFTQGEIADYREVWTRKYKREFPSLNEASFLEIFRKVAPEIGWDTEVFDSAEWAMYPAYRRSEFPYMLLWGMFIMAVNYAQETHNTKLLGFGYSTEDSTGYKMMVKLGAQKLYSQLPKFIFGSNVSDLANNEKYKIALKEFGLMFREGSL